MDHSYQLSRPSIETIIDYCNDLLADEKLTVFEFGENCDLVLHIYKDEEFNPALDKDYSNIVTIHTAQDGKWIDDTEDVYVTDGSLYRELERINIAYGNLDALQDDRKLIFTCRKFDLEKLINESNEKLECQIGYWFDNGKQISLGQWQKIGLARAFFKDADLYILDEPNAALDAITEYRLSVLYKELLKKKKGIIVAHKFNNLVKQVDDIIVLEYGEITGIGSHENLLKTNETYKTLYEMQVG